MPDKEKKSAGKVIEEKDEGQTTGGDKDESTKAPTHGDSLPADDGPF